MRAVLGVEGGGSHTHAVVADASGQILGVGKNNDAANWEDVGISAASAAIRSCVTEAIGAAGLQTSEISTSVFGLAGIDFPTLIVVGDEDTLTPVAEAEALRAGIRGARLEIIDGAGHLSNLEQPEKFNSVLIDFINSLQ